MPDILNSRASIQNAIEKLEHQAKQNVMKLNKEKSKVLQLVKKKPKHQYRRESDWLSSPAEKDLRITVDIKLEMSEWCALIKRRANQMLGFIRENVASRSMEGIIHTLPGSCAASSEILCPVWGFPVHKTC